MNKIPESPQQAYIEEYILSVIGGGDILFLVPPFGRLKDIALGPLVLHTLAKEKGYTSEILYLNILFASILGVDLYEEIESAPLFWMLRERLFARSAYGLPRLGKSPEYCADEAFSISGSRKHVTMFWEDSHHVDLARLRKVEQFCHAFINNVVAVIASLNYNIVGCTAIMGQTNCGVALLAGIKKKSPPTVTIMGGNNCEGDMAEGIASLSPAIDYIFSGESEIAFLRFLEAYTTHALPSQRILSGKLLDDLDSLCVPDYDIFFQQYARCFGEDTLKHIKIWYETSRGCWWGEASRCTFCGIPQMTYRQKSLEKVVHDFKRIKVSYPNHVLFIADNIMPQVYHKELLPVITGKDEYPSLAYHIRANADLHDLVRMKDAKISVMLPGIEAFSTSVLKLMRKGLSGRQSLFFLRNAMCAGIYCDWFLLWGIPEDNLTDYQELLRILPLIRHLQPPRQFTPMILMRFSPYVDYLQEYQITDLQPWEVYRMIYPDWAKIENLAYYYTGDYPSEARDNPELIRQIAAEVAVWKKTWKQAKLMMKPFMGNFLIYDKREQTAPEKTHVLEYERARDIMTSRMYDDSDSLQWAVAEKLGVVLDCWYVPLVTATPEVLLEMTTERTSDKNYAK